MTDYTIYHSLNKVDEGPSMGLDTFEERRADSDQRFIKLLTGGILYASFPE